MSSLIFIVGLVFSLSSFLAIVNISYVGLDLVMKTRIHQLPFLNTFPSAYIYLFLGLALMLLSRGFVKR
jgi:hypothetical protein